MENQERSSNFYQLTAQVLNDKNLNHAEKLTMAILYGLSDENGKCWPSNEWLCEKLDLKPRAVQDIISHLVKLNYISRDIISCVNNPFKKYRIILVENNFKKSRTHAENCTLGNEENCMSDMQKTAHIIDKKEVIDKKEEREAASPPPAPQFCYKRLKMQQSRYENLVFQHGEEKVKRFMDELDEYADIAPKKFKEYGDHAVVLARWIRREEDYMPSGKSQYRGHQDALECIKKIDELCLPSFCKDIQTGTDYVHFIKVPGGFFKADDPKFPLAVKILLQKIGVSSAVIKKIFKN